MTEERPSVRKVISTLAIIFAIVIVVFYVISFISGAPDRTNKFLLSFGLFIVVIELVAIVIWQFSILIKRFRY